MDTENKSCRNCITARENGGTYAHKEIALQFMCRISAEMMLKVIQKYLEDTDYEENN